MKYKNILGKDFNTKKESKEYFKNILYSIKKPSDSKYLTFTENTLIKQSQIVFLYNNYLTKDEDTLSTVFRGETPRDWGCLFLSNGIINLTFKLDARVGGKKNIPISPWRIFTCFGAAIINHGLNNKKTSRFLIQDQRVDFLKKFVKEKEFIKQVNGNVIDITNVYNKNYECENCKLFFNYEDIEVHHLIPFIDIYNEWKENVWKEDLFSDSTCSSFGADADESWCDFHLNLASYQKLCKTCHSKETHG